MNASGPPRVSIVVPNYNYAQFLDERLTSLLNQTFENFEVIVVDDASTDGSRDVIERFRSDSRVRTLWFDENSGDVFKRWSDGAAQATGEYLMFAGADDSCEPELLETLVRVMDANAGVGVACAQSWEIDADGRIMRLKQQKPRWAKDFIATGAEEAQFTLTEPTIQNASAALVRREVFERVGGFDRSMGICADWHMWAKVVSVSDLAFVAKPLNRYRKHGRTVRSRQRKGTDLPFQYPVVASMLRLSPLSDQDRERAWDRVANVWISLLVDGGVSMDRQLQRQIYRAARANDPAILRRLLRLLVHRSVQRLRRLWRGRTMETSA